MFGTGEERLHDHCKSNGALYGSLSDSLIAERLQNYLVYWGYLLDGSFIPGDFAGASIAALEAFKEEHNLAGVADSTKAVHNALAAAVCGVPRNQGGGWTSTTLYYRARKANIPSAVGAGSWILFNQAVQRAAEFWTTHSGFTLRPFVESDPTRPSNVVVEDITVSFVDCDHDCVFSFDGPGGLLGHMPGLPGAKNNSLVAGDIHLDAAETWSVSEDPNETGGVDLLTVLIHEFGHSIGLEHDKKNKDSIMYHRYTGVKRTMEIDSDRAAASRLGRPTAEGAGW